MSEPSPTTLQLIRYGRTLFLAGLGTAAIWYLNDVCKTVQDAKENAYMLSKDSTGRAVPMTEFTMTNPEPTPN